MSLARALEIWSRRNPREQRLAIAVAAMIAVLVALGIVAAGRQVIAGLDREIARLADELRNQRRQQGLRAEIEARFGAVATQHSSAWTESEIRDRLRQEIYRLSNIVPPELDPGGAPRTTDNGSGALVVVPELGAGRLAAGGEGFREYELEFSVQPAPMPRIAAYIERLMESPQSLRVDRLDLRRAPDRSEFAATLAITRVVVDNPAAAGGAAPGTDLTLDPAAWSVVGGEVARDGGSGGELIVRGTADRGSAWFARALPAGSAFEATLELSATAPGALGVWSGDTPLAAEGPGAIEPGDGYLRYRFQFTVPDGQTEPGELRFPVIQWERGPAEFRIRRLSIGALGGAGT